MTNINYVFSLQEININSYIDAIILDPFDGNKIVFTTNYESLHARNEASLSLSSSLVLTNYELFVEILRADKITKIAPDLFANLISSKQKRLQ